MADWAKELSTELPGTGKESQGKTDWGAELQKPEVSQAAEFKEAIHADPDTMAWKDVFKSAVEKSPESFKQYGMDFVEAATSPLETAKGVGKLVAGGAQKLIPGQQSEAIEEQEQTFDAFIGHFKGKYGSVEGFKKALAKDPANILGDVLTLAVPGGAGVKAAGVATGAKGLVKVGQTMGKTAKALEPVGLAARTTAKVGGKMFSAIGLTPTKMYESAAKFSTKLTRTERTALTKTALDRSISVSLKGLDKLEKAAESYRNVADSLVDSATAAGKRIHRDWVFKEFAKLEKGALLEGLPKTARKQINRVRNEITEELTRAGKVYLNPTEAQKLKRGIYKRIEKYYAATAKETISVDAQMAVARAAKEGLEVLIPEIKGVNKNLGEVVALKKALNQAANRVTNRDLMGIGVPIKVAAGGTAGGPVGAAGGLLSGLLDVPSVKSRLAIVVKKMQKSGVVFAPDHAIYRLGLYQTEKSKDSF